MKDILQMDKEELIALKPIKMFHLLAAEEVIHIATVLGAFWTYDYAAAKQGKVGMHAILKSGLHSDGSFASKILLGPENIRHILSYNIAMRLRSVVTFTSWPDYVVGVPDGATSLGSNIAKIMGSREAYMKKVDGRIVLDTEIPNGATMLLVEDFCTRGTGFIEAVLEVKSKQPSIKLLPYDPVIINRGGLREISVADVGIFSVLPVVERRILDWNPNEYCPLCALGSIAIKPKVTDENWQLLVTSQL